jgi:hypothetical protein
LNVDGAADFDNTVDFGANITQSGGTASFGNTSVGTLGTSGLATLHSASVTNNASVGGTLTVTGVSNLNGGTSTSTLDASGQSTLAATDITGATNILGTTNINGSGNAVTNIGNSTGAGSATNVLGTLSVTGASTVSSITASGLADLNGNLDVAGTTVLGNNLTVNGTSDLNGSVDIDANIVNGPALSITNTASSGTSYTLEVLGQNSEEIAGDGATVKITNSTNGYALKSSGQVLVLGYVEGATTASPDAPLYQIGDGLDHGGLPNLMTQGFIIGGDVDTRQRMYFNSASGDFVVGPVTQADAANSNDLFTVSPTTMNVTIDGTGNGSSADLLSIVHASADGNSSALEITNSVSPGGGAGSAAPLVRFNRTNEGNGSALEVALDAASAPGTYALEVSSLDANSGAIYAIADDAGAVAGRFEHDDPSAVALNVVSGTLYINDENNGGGARLAGGVQVVPQSSDINGNSLIYHYTGNNLDVSQFGPAPVDGTIIYVICELAQVGINDENNTNIDAQEVASFVYYPNGVGIENWKRVR